MDQFRGKCRRLYVAYNRNDPTTREHFRELLRSTDKPRFNNVVDGVIVPVGLDNASDAETTKEARKAAKKLRAAAKRADERAVRQEKQAAHKAKIQAKKDAQRAAKKVARAAAAATFAATCERVR